MSNCTCSQFHDGNLLLDTGCPEHAVVMHRDAYDKLIHENEVLKEKADWCKEVEEGNEYPEKLNDAMVRISATLSHMRDGNYELAHSTLKEWFEKFDKN
jgi:hypothetical protein